MFCNLRLSLHNLLAKSISVNMLILIASFGFLISYLALKAAPGSTAPSPPEPTGSESRIILSLYLCF